MVRSSSRGKCTICQVKWGKNRYAGEYLHRGPRGGFSQSIRDELSAICGIADLPRTAVICCSHFNSHNHSRGIRYSKKKKLTVETQGAGMNVLFPPTQRLSPQERQKSRFDRLSNLSKRQNSKEYQKYDHFVKKSTTSELVAYVKKLESENVRLKKIIEEYEANCQKLEENLRKVEQEQENLVAVPNTLSFEVHRLEDSAKMKWMGVSSWTMYDKLLEGVRKHVEMPDTSHWCSVYDLEVALRISLIILRQGLTFGHARHFPAQPSDWYNYR